MPIFPMMLTLHISDPADLPATPARPPGGAEGGAAAANGGSAMPPPATPSSGSSSTSSKLATGKWKPPLDN